MTKTAVALAPMIRRRPPPCQPMWCGVQRCSTGRALDPADAATRDAARLSGHGPLPHGLRAGVGRPGHHGTEPPGTGGRCDGRTVRARVKLWRVCGVYCSTEDSLWYAHALSLGKDTYGPT